MPLLRYIYIYEAPPAPGALASAGRSSVSSLPLVLVELVPVLLRRERERQAECWAHTPVTSKKVLLLNGQQLNLSFVLSAYMNPIIVNKHQATQCVDQTYNAHTCTHKHLSMIR